MSIPSRASTTSNPAAQRVTIGDKLIDDTVQAARWTGSIRIPDFLLFAFLIVIQGLPLPSIGIPKDNFVLAVILVLGLIRKPQFSLGKYQILVPLFAAALFYVGVLSLFADPNPGASDWQTRLLRFMAVTLLIYVVAAGRVDARSAILGMATALTINVPLFYAGLVPAPYGEYLTGMVGDKNVSGLAYALTGLLSLYVVRNSRVRIPVIVFFGISVWLTGSRTAIAAFLSGLAWVWLAPKLSRVGRWVLGGLIAIGVGAAAEDFSHVGRFSAREGSDLLRERIDEASRLKTAESGVFGQGLGEAFVWMDDDTWFFHNSYWSALTEGGWLWTLFVVGVTVLIMIRPFAGRVLAQHYIAQGAGVVILVCAWRLGEVFYTVYWGFAVGFALFLILSEQGQSTSQRADSEG